jgi:4-aminobutyrate aminotransferase
MAGPVRAFLTNSGTEAVEGALKLARAATGRQYVISFYGAFHGRSYGSVSLTASKAKYHAGFGPLLAGVLHAPYGYCHRCPLNLTFPECGHATVDWLEDTLFRYEVDPAEVAAVFVEPIQGEGGYIPPPPGWLAKLKAAVRAPRHPVRGRRGPVGHGPHRAHVGHRAHRGRADVLIAAKGIASGLPLGAFMARDELWRWPKGAHGSTYGGSPVPCAAGLATLEVIEDEGLLANATAQGDLLREGLDRLQAPLRLAGRGRPRGRPHARGRVPHGQLAEEVQLACFRRGLLVLEAGESAVRLSPPLVVTDDQCRTALRLFTEAVEEVAASLPAPDPESPPRRWWG